MLEMKTIVRAFLRLICQEETVLKLALSITPQMWQDIQCTMITQQHADVISRALLTCPTMKNTLPCLLHPLKICACAKMKGTIQPATPALDHILFTMPSLARNFQFVLPLLVETNTKIMGFCLGQFVLTSILATSQFQNQQSLRSVKNLTARTSTIQ